VDLKDLAVLEDPEDQEDHADPEDQADTADQVCSITVHKSKHSVQKRITMITIVFLQRYLECRTCRQAKSHPDNQAAITDPVDLVDQADPEDQADQEAPEDQKRINQLEHQADQKDLAVL
jgi:hypothetical protein